MFEPRQLQINPQYIAEQWQEQSGWMEDACLLVAKAKLSLSECKRLFDLTDARLSLAVRKNPGSYGIDKSTETAIAACVITQDEYQKALEACNKAKYDVDVREALVNALIDRRKGLEDNVQLLQLGICSIPNHQKTYAIPPSERRKRNV